MRTHDSRRRRKPWIIDNINRDGVAATSAFTGRTIVGTPPVASSINLIYRLGIEVVYSVIDVVLDEATVYRNVFRVSFRVDAVVVFGDCISRKAGVMGAVDVDAFIVVQAGITN